MKTETSLMSSAVREAARRSVLCWLATVDADGKPNASSKEVWTIADNQDVVVAHIASPLTARNIAQQPQVCLSFVAPIVALSYRFFPDDTTEAAQVASAMRTCGVKPAPDA